MRQPVVIKVFFKNFVCSFLFVLLASAMLMPALARAQSPDVAMIDPRFQMLITRLQREGFPREWLETIFANDKVHYDPAFMGKKMRVLYRAKYDIPAPPRDKPVNSPSWKYLYEPHLTPEVRAELKEFNKTHATELRNAASKYKVQKEVILALLVVETKLGSFLGDQDALSVLASMAVTRKYADVSSFFSAHPAQKWQIPWIEERMRQKSDWAYGQLLSLLSFSRVNNLQPGDMPSSIYGAIGICQFMPSSALHYGRDGDNDGVVDLYNPCDAVASVGYYMSKAGWRNNHSRKRKIKALKRYNNDNFYARTVLSVAGELGGK